MKADSGTPKPFTIPRALGMLMPTFVLLPHLGWLVGVDYDAIADSTPNILRGIVPAVGLSLIWGILILAAIVWALGKKRQPVSIPSSP